jgi:molybdopterin/thiamine biosynthesis adenylyltransferase
VSPGGYDDYVAYSRQHFEEGLIRAGFTEKDTGWQGPVSHSGSTTEVLITPRSSFPFQPPRVVPVDPAAVAWSWHREIDGALCLIAEDDHDGLWWTEAGAFLEHVTAWFEQADLGWSDDRLDLDLDRYFHASEDTRLYLYGGLDQHHKRFVRFHPAKNDTMLMRSGTPPAKISRLSKDRFGYVADLGDLDVPPRAWSDVASRIDPSMDLSRKIRQYAVTILVLTYRRGVHDGAIMLEVRPTKGGDIALKRLRSGADTEAARSVRAGALAPALRERRVAIVGVGALGSFIADTLVRSGVRSITLIDHDVVMPGNLVRHLVGPDAVGLTKVEAVKRHLDGRSERSTSEISVSDCVLATGQQAHDLLMSHDLVVNATADFATTALLHITADSLGKNIVSVALQGDGTICRIDVLPPLDGADLLPPSAFDSDWKTAEVFEAGCGSPISPTPPYAVIEAAAAAVRHIVGLLTERPLHPAGEVLTLALGPGRDNQ